MLNELLVSKALATWTIVTVRSHEKSRGKEEGDDVSRYEDDERWLVGDSASMPLSVCHTNNIYSAYEFVIILQLHIENKYLPLLVKFAKLRDFTFLELAKLVAAKVPCDLKTSIQLAAFNVWTTTHRPHTHI